MHQIIKKKNGAIYHPPADFYIRNGFRIFPDIEFETDKLKAIKIKWKKIISMKKTPLLSIPVRPADHQQL